MSIAVLDFGKTNTKLLVFDTAGKIVFSTRTRPVWHAVGGMRVLDDQVLAQWAHEGLAAVEGDRPGDMIGVMVSAHGCTFALADAQALVRPILDYEQELPGSFSERVDSELPPYAETFAPLRPQGFNYGRHMLWLQHLEPQSFERATAILGYPQYWSWRMGGRQVAERTYMGCHSHLWAPALGTFSSLVDGQGWRHKMPEFARAGAVIGEIAVRGRRIAVHNGVHDSNASLQAYRSLGLQRFTLISTGTWVIIFNPDCPLSALDAATDMYCNVDVNGRAVPTIGFMGGREFDVIAGELREAIDRDAVQRAIDARHFAFPAFAAGGPYGGRTGRVEPSLSDAADRAAVAILYVALMIDWCLDAIQSDNILVIDGGLTTGGVLGELVAQLRPAQTVLEGAISEGTAAGAATLAFAAHGLEMRLPEPVSVADRRYRGIDAYRREWREQLPSLPSKDPEMAA